MCPEVSLKLPGSVVVKMPGKCPEVLLKGSVLQVGKSVKRSGFVEPVGFCRESGLPCDLSNVISQIYQLHSSFLFRRRGGFFPGL